MPERQVQAAYYAGANAFLRAPLVEVDRLKAGDVGVMGAPVDFWALSRTGQRWGPAAIRRESMYWAAHYEYPELLDPLTGTVSRPTQGPRLFDLGDIETYPTDVARQTQCIIDAVKAVSSRGAFPVVLGGDHYVAYPSFEGFAAGYHQRQPGATFGYLHLDSHTDFLDATPSLGRYNHATCTRRVSENPAVVRMAWVGINWPVFLDVEMLATMERRGFAVFTSDSIRQRGMDAVMREALEFVSEGADAVYVSLDIDIVDGAYAPATHSPSFDGITSRDLIAAMRVLSSAPKVQALDVCEVIPAQDCSQMTERLAALALFTALRPRILDLSQLPESRMKGGVFR